VTGLLEASVGRWLRFFVEAVPCRGTAASCPSWRDMRKFLRPLVRLRLDSTA
jgi:hypothetical protein